jgi:hypothetical protein
MTMELSYQLNRTTFLRHHFFFFFFFSSEFCRSACRGKCRPDHLNSVQGEFLLRRLIRLEDSMSITSFKDFSNEILLEIFADLNAFHLFRAFVHLNDRFEQLLFSPSLRLKVILGYSTVDQFRNSTYKQFLLDHRQRIESLSLEGQQTFSSFSFNVFLFLKSI